MHIIICRVINYYAANNISCTETTSLQMGIGGKEFALVFVPSNIIQILSKTYIFKNSSCTLPINI